jgi:hypothetical protein
VLQNNGNLITPDIGVATGSSLVVTGSLTSTIPTGTAPIIVVSKTVVSNLNVSMLNGSTFSIPGSIGNTTPGSGAFTSLSASTGFTSTIGTTSLGITTTGSLSSTTGNFTGSVNMNSNNITNLANPVLQTDATTKGYVDSIVLNLLDYIGGYDASTNVYPSTGGSGTSGAIRKGNLWVISVAGVLSGNAIQIGDSIIANIDNPGQIGGNWNTLSGNISYVTENQANRVNSISSMSSNIQYPSAKLLFDQLALKQALLVSGSNIRTINGNTLLNSTDLVIGGYNSIDSGTNITVTSNIDTPFISLTPSIGTYIVDFNGQCSVPTDNKTTGFSTVTAASDLNLICNDISALTVTNTTHALTFGSGEVLYPGIYYISGAVSIAGNLTLDGNGITNPVFVIRTPAAFNTGAGVTVTLINGAVSSNIFWVADGAIGLGASTIIQGNIISTAGAVAVGATCTISGRLLSKAGALSFGPGSISVPTTNSIINFRTLLNFCMFTSSGGVANTGTSTFTGDISTGLGAITGFTGSTVNGVIYQAGSTTTVTPVIHLATFSLYKNGILIPNSSRTRSPLLNSDIYLHGAISVTSGQNVEVRCSVDSQVSDNGGMVNISNRIFTLTKVI